MHSIAPIPPSHSSILTCSDRSLWTCFERNRTWTMNDSPHWRQSRNGRHKPLPTTDFTLCRCCQYDFVGYEDFNSVLVLKDAHVHPNRQSARICLVNPHCIRIRPLLDLEVVYIIFETSGPAASAISVTTRAAPESAATLPVDEVMEGAVAPRVELFTVVSLGSHSIMSPDCSWICKIICVVTGRTCCYCECEA